jgi:acyl phosphate:glycerol-3-phosphate acyltransferase
VTAGSILTAVGLVIFGYLMGSLSPSVWLGKAVKGVDLRRHGSGNAGTTNAFRVLGKGVGVWVLICDVLKGVIPVVLSRYVSNPPVTVLVAIAAVVGHTFSIFLRGRGGKGVATGAGAAIAMIPVPMACLVGFFLFILLGTRIVSVASIASTVALPVGAGLLYHYHLTGVWATPLAYVVACCLMAAVVLWGHRTNVGRLLHGTENRVVFPWNKKAKERTQAAKAASGGQSL